MTDDVYNAAKAALENIQRHGSALQAIIADEQNDGHMLVRTGVGILPAHDWHPDTVVTLDAKRREMRLVLLRALHQRTGAMTRLVTNARLAGWTPVVIEPNRLLMAILMRWRWQHSVLGEGIERENQWRPPA